MNSFILALTSMKDQDKILNNQINQLFNINLNINYQINHKINFYVHHYKIVIYIIMISLGLARDFYFIQEALGDSIQP